MTNFTTRIMIAAATLVVAAGSASAQTLNAEIPFGFRAGGVMMQAGSYQLNIETGSGAAKFQLKNANGGRSVLLIPAFQHDTKKEWARSGKPVLSFQCGASHCALAEVWTGSRTGTYNITIPKLGKDEPTRTALVIMHSGKSD